LQRTAWADKLDIDFPPLLARQVPQDITPRCFGIASRPHSFQPKGSVALRHLLQLCALDITSPSRWHMGGCYLILYNIIFILRYIARSMPRIFCFHMPSESHCSSPIFRFPFVPIILIAESRLSIQSRSLNLGLPSIAPVTAITAIIPIAAVTRRSSRCSSRRGGRRSSCRGRGSRRRVGGNGKAS
jgi:hypothetical protein